ncbi:MAG: polyprenyl diphosphate synthase [Minisyncoccia bacterium]
MNEVESKKMRNKIPETLGIIMDGNRRWAKRKGKSSLYGHQAGYKKLEEVIEWAVEHKIKNVIVYAFSTENWNRTKTEVGGLMRLLKFVLTKKINEWNKKGVEIGFIGNRTHFSKEIQSMMKKAEKQKPDKKIIRVISAQSYGGRDEIIRAVQKIVKNKKAVSEKEFSNLLDTKDVPDPDLIIRTGGEIRISNFLLWQGAYSELFFTNTLWPDFSKKEFTNILNAFTKRERRNGK